MIRISIYLSNRQLEYAKQESERLGVSYSEVIRRILDEQIKNNQ